MRNHVAIPGSDKRLLPNSRPAGPVDASQMVSVTVRVRSTGDTQDLAGKARDLAATPLADRVYLTREQLAAQHGADPADLDKVEHFAQAHNLMVSHRSAAQRSIMLTGTLGDILAAFHTDLRMYHHASGTYRGRRGEIFIPEELQGIVTGVFGLDTRPKHRAPHREKRAALSGPGGANGVVATDFATRYQFPTQQNGTVLDGAGQTIAIIELGGGYQSSDLQIFFREAGIPMPNVSAISVDNAANAPTTADSADGEVMLDIEVAGAVAPGANIAVYFAPNNGDQGFLDAISAAVHDSERNPSVISISWGSPEDATDQQGISAYHDLFSAAGALGITICVAAGDHGTADMDSSSWDNKIHVDHPSSDDLVLSCGGTQIDPTSGQDVVWNDGTPFDVNAPGGGGWATGGGVSEIFAVPAYQANAKVPVSIDDGKPGRGVPDIAMSATNYFTRVDTFEGASGGTSAVAPLMAALVARLNQAKGKNVGYLNPFLYANPGVFTDVTAGTNAITNTVKGYTAGPGWDACSGLGAPNGTAILNALP
jgi:kumamolisin